MKTTRLFGPAVGATLAIIIVWGLSVRPAQAVPYVVTMEQVGANVVATGSGAIDLTGLSFRNGEGPGPFPPVINPGAGAIRTGSTGNVDTYTGPISGPIIISNGSFTLANSGTGDVVGIIFFATDIAYHAIEVPEGYMSNSPLSNNATWNNATFSSLGAMPGTYVWTWGTGADQNFTIDIVAPAVPDTGSTFTLLFLSLGALFGATRLRSRQLA